MGETAEALDDIEVASCRFLDETKDLFITKRVEQLHRANLVFNLFAVLERQATEYPLNPSQFFVITARDGSVAGGACLGVCRKCARTISKEVPGKLIQHENQKDKTALTISPAIGLSPRVVFRHDRLRGTAVMPAVNRQGRF